MRERWGEATESKRWIVPGPGSRASRRLIRISSSSVHGLRVIGRSAITSEEFRSGRRRVSREETHTEFHACYVEPFYRLSADDQDIVDFAVALPGRRRDCYGLKSQRKFRKRRQNALDTMVEEQQPELSVQGWQGELLRQSRLSVRDDAGELWTGYMNIPEVGKHAEEGPGVHDWGYTD